MATTTTTTVTTAKSPSALEVSRLDPAQTLKACRALLKHMRTKHLESQASRSKPNLLAANDDETSPDAEDAETSAELNELPIWLILSTKRHIVDKVRFKPRLIPVPHSLHNSNTRILLIMAEPLPPRRDPNSSSRAALKSDLPTAKTVIRSEDFPANLGKQITTLRLSKLKKNHTSYEARRLLRDSHDLFLADERIFPLLPKILGKPFFASTAKRPLPVCLTGLRTPAEKASFIAGRIKTAKGVYPRDARPPLLAPAAMAHSIRKVVNAVPVHLCQSTSLDIRVGRAGWTPEMVSENLEKVVREVVGKQVEKGWEGVKAVWVRGPETVSLPIWMCERLWIDGQDFKAEEEKKSEVEKIGEGEEEGGDGEVAGESRKAIEGSKGSLDEASKTRKRKEREGSTNSRKGTGEGAKGKKQKRQAVGET